jgi:hypothetical protein
MLELHAGVARKVKTQQWNNAVEVLALQDGDVPEHSGRELQGEARVRCANVGDKARPVRKRWPLQRRSFDLASHQRALPNQAP